jgi:TRAP-type C4-dicarboxylate transport system substrate-binding protein
MTRSLRILLGATLLAAALPVHAQGVTLRAVGFLPKNHPVMAMNQIWVDDINAALAGKVKVNYVGGPEVLPGLQQAEAVSKGVIDIAFNPTAYYQSLLPEVSAFILSRKSPTEERAPNGFYDYMAKRHETIGIRYLGRTQTGSFYIWTKDKATDLNGLKGMKLRTTALYDRFMKGLGAVPVTIPEAEVYTALEGGTVSGFGWPVFGARERGWTKVVRHVIDLPFFGASNVVAIMNNDKWKALPADVQRRIIEVTAAFEPKVVKHYGDAEKAEWVQLEKAGMVRYRFSDAENKKYLDTAYNVEFENLATKVPDQVPALRKLTGN